MSDAITSAQRAMNVDKIQLDGVSHNIANIHSPGYRKQFTTVAPFEQAMDPTKNALQAQIKTTALQRQAALDNTKRPFDLAISGDGYFTIETEQGLRYTRRGDFHLNQSGELVTFDGHRVLMDGSNISLDGAPVKVGTDGALYQKNKLVARLRLTKFSSSAQFSATGHSYFSASEGGDKVDASCQVRQGFLEQSNVKTVDEMMDLMRISRHFQTSQRVMRLSDELMGKAISQLGEG